MNNEKIMLFVAFVIGLTACNNEINEIPAENSLPDVKTSITLHLPDAKKVNVYSTATQDECYIDSIYVLEFDATTSALLHDTLIHGANIQRNGEALQLLPQLPFKLSNGNKVILVANTPLEHPFDYKTDPSNFMNYFERTFIVPAPYHFIFLNGLHHLPMCGEFIVGTDYDCTMIRAVAKIQVRLAENYTDVTGSFKHDSVTFTVAGITFGGMVTGGSYQYNSSHYGYQRTYYCNSRGDFDYWPFHLLQDSHPLNTVYIYGYQTSIYTDDGAPTSPKLTQNILYAKKAFAQRRMHISLKKSTSTGDTYYRLDFYDRNKREYLDVDRNHHYLFTINNVRSEGYHDPDRASDMPGSNIEYTVEVLGDYQHITSNGQYAVITNVDTVFLNSYGVHNNVASVFYQMSADSVSSEFYDRYIASDVCRDSVKSDNPLLTFQIPAHLSGFATVAAPITNPVTGGVNTLLKPIVNTERSVDIQIASPFQEGVITFSVGNINHRLVVKYRP